jgi:hypothetical protein
MFVHLAPPAIAVGAAAVKPARRGELVTIMCNSTFANAAENHEILIWRNIGRRKECRK